MTPSNPFLGDDVQDVGTQAMPPCKSARAALSVVRISGDDARDFLHGQFSADLRRLTVGDCVLTAWLGPKGRVLFLPRLLRGDGQSWYALLPAAQCAAFVKRLRMFVLRAKVSVEDCAQSHGVLVVDGGNAPSIDAAELVMARDGERLWLAGPRPVLAAMWDAVPLPAQNAAAALVTDIARGDVLLDAALSDEFLPQELDLDARQGVSFNKGCYPGQEIVARVKFRGTVKRRLQRLRVTGTAVPPPGTRLLGADDAHRGTLLMSAARDATTVEMLGVVDLDSGPLHLADEPTARIDMLPLPYTVAGA